jgi:predicted dienelactone hydrolase
MRMGPWMVVLAACGAAPSQQQTVDAPVSGDGAVMPDAPGPAVDPAEDGPATVTESNATIPGAGAGRTLAATVFVPAGAGPRPLAIVSPGFQMARAQYASYAHHLATWGFAVILTDYAESGFSIDHDRIASDVPAVIDWALAQQALAVDAAKIATLGHSLGGKTSVFAAAKDVRIKAVVAWDPVDSNNPSVAPQQMGGITAAIAVIGETTNASGGFMPCAPAAENFQQFYAAAPSPAMAVTVTGADHMDWVDDPSCGFCGFCTAGTASPGVVRRVTRRLDVAWLRRQLLADTAMDAWLDAPPEASSLTIERR